MSSTQSLKNLNLHCFKLVLYHYTLISKVMKTSNKKETFSIVKEQHKIQTFSKNYSAMLQNIW